MFLPDREIPFEMYLFWRNFKVTDSDQEKESENIGSQINIEKWHERKILFQPHLSSCIKLYLQSSVGDVVDFLPLIHPFGYPKSLILDYKNHLGNGKSALYLQSASNQYF